MGVYNEIPEYRSKIILDAASIGNDGNNNHQLAASEWYPSRSISDEYSCPPMGILALSESIHCWHYRHDILKPQKR